MTAPKCKSGTCPNRAYVGRYCKKHAAVLKVKGVRGMVNARPAGGHAAKLRLLGWSDNAIAKRAGVSQSQVWYLRNGREQAHARVVNAVLSVPLELADSMYGVDSTGTRRRVAALNWMGHSRAFIAAQIGWGTHGLMTVIYRPRVSSALARAVANVFEQWAHVPGDNPHSAAMAKAHGALPWSAWEDLDIDDPAVRPNLTGYDEQLVCALVRGESVGADRVDRVEATARLSEQGLTRQEVALRLDVSRSTVDLYLREAA
jgi:transcriptional regulator with XRE-family HTH domain